MDYGEDYDLYLKMLNDTNTIDPSYVGSEPVKICSKERVNYFGATFIPVFYDVIFILSYLGNGLVLFIIYKFEKLNTVTNVFLLNLVLSNILFATSLPFLGDIPSVRVDFWLVSV